MCGEWPGIWLQIFFTEHYGIWGAWKEGLECGFFTNWSDHASLGKWWWQGNLLKSGELNHSCTWCGSVFQAFSNSGYLEFSASCLICGWSEMFLCYCLQVKIWCTRQESSVINIDMKANICCVKYNPGSSSYVAVRSSFLQNDSCQYPFVPSFNSGLLDLWFSNMYTLGLCYYLRLWISSGCRLVLRIITFIILMCAILICPCICSMGTEKLFRMLSSYLQQSWLLHPPTALYVFGMLKITARYATFIISTYSWLSFRSVSYEDDSVCRVNLWCIYSVFWKFWRCTTISM